MPSRPQPAGDNRHTYIPPAAQAAMSQQLQSMPAHLKQYVSSDRPTYIPQQVQKELTNFMQSSAPSHLKQYAGAFVEQNVVTPTRPTAPRPTGNRPPIPDRLNLSHSGDIATEQANAQFLNLFQADIPQGGAPTVSPTPQPTSPAAAPSNPSPPTGNYDFILNNQPPSRSGPFNFNFGGSSLTKRMLIGVAGVVVLLMLIVVLKGALGGSNKALPDLIGIVQDQQELISVVSDGTQHASDQNLKNFAYTAQLSLQSEESQLVSYLKQADNHKVSSKEADLKISRTVANQLTAALTATNYDATFSSIMQSQLKTYQQDLQQTYQVEKGPHGRALLNNFYNDTSLLLKQLGNG